MPGEEEERPRPKPELATGGDPPEIALYLWTEEEQNRWLPACNDVSVWLGFLRNSPPYREVIGKRLGVAQENYDHLLGRGVTPEFPPPSAEEAVAAFEGTEEFKQMVWDYNETCIHLKYEPAKLAELSPEIVRTFQEYRHHAIVSFRAVEEPTEKEKEKKEELDRIRSEYHDKAAKAIVAAFAAEAERTNRPEPVVKTEFLARIIVRAFLVDEGNDYTDSARLSDVNRRLRTFPDPVQVANYLSIVHLHSRGQFVFSPEQAAVIQEKFRQGYGRSTAFVPDVEPQVYNVKPDYTSKSRFFQGGEDQENQDIPRIIRRQKNNPPKP